MSKVIYIVGMGAGVSAAVARRFGRDGYTVGAVARNAEKLAQQVDALRGGGITAFGASADAGTPESLREGLSRLQSELGPADVLVYNAAGVTFGPLAQVSTQSFATDIATSIVGAFVAAQFVLPAMYARRAGSILLTGGGFAFEPNPEMISLGVGKAGIRNLAFGLHGALKDSGIHAATVTICGVVAEATPFDPGRIADAFWTLHAQPAGAFDREFQFRG